MHIIACGACRSIPDGFSHVTEGQATILQQGNNVFYNKAQVVNRDVSMAVLRWFIEQRHRHPVKAKRAQKPSVPTDTMLKVSCRLQAIGDSVAYHSVAACAPGLLHA
jgi:tRNA G26 N,N-dimethylase Trm1